MNILIMIIFLVLAAFTLLAGIMVVTVKNIIHSALWLIASFFTVAALYLLMEAEFLAIVQVLIYVGAISILILFAIMLTRHVTGEGIRQLYQRIAGARGHQQVVGTAASIADQLQQWFEEGGADGFNIMAPWFPGGLEEFIQLVLPELRRRGLFRTDYIGRTLREHLGLERPAHARAVRT